MKCKVKILAKNYAKKQAKIDTPKSHNQASQEHKKFDAENANFDTYAYTEYGYVSMMKKLDELYDIVDSIPITEKFLSGD